jgi:hypothetical protein
MAVDTLSRAIALDCLFHRLPVTDVINPFEGGDDLLVRIENSSI